MDLVDYLRPGEFLTILRPREATVSWQEDSITFLINGETFSFEWRGMRWELSDERLPTLLSRKLEQRATEILS